MWVIPARQSGVSFRTVRHIRIAAHPTLKNQSNAKEPASPNPRPDDKLTADQKDVNKSPILSDSTTHTRQIDQQLSKQTGLGYKLIIIN